ARIVDEHAAFHFRALFAMRQTGSVAVWKAPYGQSGKEAEKPIGKILARTAFRKLLYRCFGRSSLSGSISFDRDVAVNIV
ncbi:hypothetical protein, partial [Mesorhizobium sp.]|uniref:hypothetical protein n=1 Tax=Mesorhizobium sp. TaxID=1871066 RepID=UPI0025D17A76